MIGKAKQEDTWMTVPVSKHKLPEVTVVSDQNPLLSDCDNQCLLASKITREMGADSLAVVR